MEKKYRALRTIATIFKVLGWLILVLGILSACAASASIVGGRAIYFGGMVPGAGRTSQAGLVGSLVIAVVTFIITIVTVGLYALLLIAASEGIQVFLDIEQNVREMAKRLAQGGAAAPPPPPSQ